MAKKPKLTGNFEDKLQGAAAGYAPVNQPFVVPAPVPGTPVMTFPASRIVQTPGTMSWNTPPEAITPIVMQPQREKVAIIGTAPSSRMLAPFNDPTWDIWVCSPGNMPGPGFAPP